MTAPTTATTAKKGERSRRRVIDMERHQFRQLSELIKSSLAALVEFAPERDNPGTLRKQHDPMYEFLAKYASVGFGKPMESALMSGLAIEGIDMVNCEASVSFLYSMARTNYRHELVFRNFMAPYSEYWPNMLSQAGGDGFKAKQLYAMI